MALHSLVSTVVLLLYTTHIGASVTITDASVQCDPQMMHVFFDFATPFYGTIYSRDHHNNGHCRMYGEGNRKVTMSLHLNHNPKQKPFCGMRLDEGRQEFFIGLVVSDQREILVDGVQEFQVRCEYELKDVTLKLPALRGIQISQQLDAPRPAPRVIQGSGTGILPVVEMSVREGWGIGGKRVQAATIGQQISLDIHLADNAPYDFVIFNCIAHDGSRAPSGTVTLVDEKGCAQMIERVQEANVQITQDHRRIKHVFLQLRGFQFSTSDVVNFECQIRPCLDKCNVTQCSPYPIQSQAKAAVHRRSLTDNPERISYYVMDKENEVFDLQTNLVMLPESGLEQDTAPMLDLSLPASVLDSVRQQLTTSPRTPVVRAPSIPPVSAESEAAQQRRKFMSEFSHDNRGQLSNLPNEIKRQLHMPVAQREEQQAFAQVDIRPVSRSSQSQYDVRLADQGVTSAKQQPTTTTSVSEWHPSIWAVLASIFVSAVLLSICFLSGYAMYQRKDDEYHTNTMIPIR